MGGRGNSSKIKSGSRAATTKTRENSIDSKIRNSPDYIGQTAIEDQISEQVRYGMLGEGEDFIAVSDFTIESNPGNGDIGDVTATYQIRVDLSYQETDADGYTYTVPSYEYEYRTETFQVRLKK